MSAKLQSLIVSYCSMLPGDVEALAQSLSPAPHGPEAVVADLADALHRVHRIRGAGGSLGFEAVSRIAGELESRLRPRDPAVGAGSGIEMSSVRENLARLQELAAAIRPEGSSLYGIDLARMSFAGSHSRH